MVALAPGLYRARMRCGNKGYLGIDHFLVVKLDGTVVEKFMVCHVFKTISRFAGEGRQWGRKVLAGYELNEQGDFSVPEGYKEQ